MATRNACLGLLLTCWMTAGLPAQEQPDGQTINAAAAPAQDLSALTAAVQRLEMQVNQLSGKYVTREEFEKLQDNVTSLADGVRDQAQMIRDIDTKYENSIAALEEQGAQINQILNEISRPDSQNRPILNIASAMESQDFRQDFSKALDAGLPQTRRDGILTVTNNMGFPQYLRINGQYRRFEPYTTVDVPVETGTVTTELAGEDPKNWVIAPPTYRQGIIIAPRQNSILMTSF